MFLLDTNVVSELRKVRLGKADHHVASWSDAMDAAVLYISSVTVLELEIGVLRMERRDTKQGAALRAWLIHRVLPEFEERTLPFDNAVALRCAGLHVPDPRAERDAIIAATALVHRMKLVTRDVGDFANMGVEMINPWE
jgi:hypothetical protein